MLINSLGLKNFKCFEELDVKFAPITLLTGANSSGKSSLINAILAVLQTEQFPLYLSPNGKYVEMGSMKEMAYNNVTNIPIDLNIGFDLSSKTKYSFLYFLAENIYHTSWILNNKNDLPEVSKMLSISNRVKVNVKNMSSKFFVDIYIDGFSGEDGPQEYEAISHGVKNILLNRKGNNLSKEDELFNLVNLEYNSMLEFEDDLFKLKQYFFFDHQIIEAIFDYKTYVDDKFNYIGSMRNFPLRTYNQRAKVARKIDSNGEGYIDQLLEWQERDNNKFTQVTLDLSALGIFDDMKPNRLQGGRFELSVRTSNSKRWSSLADIGFGVSQFLPIIVADHQLSNNSCLAVSQPEIHLHPKIQATFGNYLANQVNSTEKQYIIETHSEYLINRIRLLLVTGELKPEQVRVLYFENDGLKSTVHDIEFATNGSVKGAPQGFFDTYEIDIMDIAMSAIG